MYKDKPFWQSKKFVALALGIVGTFLQARYGVPKELTVTLGQEIVQALEALAPLVTSLVYILAQGKVDEKLAGK